MFTLDYFHFLVLAPHHAYNDSLVYFEDMVIRQCLMLSHSHSQESLENAQKT